MTQIQTLAPLAAGGSATQGYESMAEADYSRLGYQPLA